MIDTQHLSTAQARWCALLQYYFAELYSSGIIKHKQLIEAHDKFKSLREVDKKNKVGWPIWLIMNNSIGRGQYKLPHAVVDETNQITMADAGYPGSDSEYELELEKFGITS